MSRQAHIGRGAGDYVVDTLFHLAAVIAIHLAQVHRLLSGRDNGANHCVIHFATGYKAGPASEAGEHRGIHLLQQA